MSKLYCLLGLDELHHVLRKFLCQVELFAPDSVTFQAEGRRITEEIKTLTEKAECWDVLIRYNRTIPTCEGQNLSLERERIMATFRSLFAHLEIVYNDEKANPGPNAPLGTGNDLIYSSADSDSSTTSNKGNVFRPIPVPLQQPQPQPYRPSLPGPSSVYSSSSSSSSSWTSTSAHSYYDAVTAPEAVIQTNRLPKPNFCRELQFSSGSSSASSADYSDGNWNQFHG